jgi:hypothetical protein
VAGPVTGLLASFRELRGIGPATEARLHEAGVYTWEALGDVLAALANVRGGVEGVRAELAELADARDDRDAGRDRERAEAFVLRLSVSAGAARRCSIIHVRSQEERSWPRWPPDDLIGFVRDHAELKGLPRSSPPEPGAVREPPSPQAAPSAVPQPGPPPAPVEGDAGSRHHVVVLDAGKAFGGGSRPVELLVPTAGLADRGPVDWTATLGGRAVGGDPATTWEAPDRPAGRIGPPEPMLLRFDRVPLPTGLQRLWLRLELRLAAPAVGVPELVAQRAPGAAR